MGLTLSLSALLLSACQQSTGEELASKTETDASQKLEAIEGKSTQFETQTNEQDAITVSVTPLSIFNDSGNWSFEIELTTHSAELTMELMHDAVAIDENGQEFNPISWEGDPPGGHHRSGVLIFKAMDADYLRLTLKNVSESGDRTFEFKK